MLEIIVAIALVGMVMIAMNMFIFSMGELWGRGTDARLFEQHVRAVSRFLEEKLRTAVLPPSARPGDNPIAPQEIRPQSGMMENLLTFELRAGSRLIMWPDQPLPEVVCSLQAREREGLILLWHSRLETRFADDAPRETVVSPYATALHYDYYDATFKRWTTETTLKRGNNGAIETPQRLRLKFAYDKMTRESVITLPVVEEGLPGL